MMAGCGRDVKGLFSGGGWKLWEAFTFECQNSTFHRTLTSAAKAHRHNLEEILREMRKHFVIVLCLAILGTVSCSKTSRFEQSAQQAIVEEVTERAIVPNSVKLLTQKTLYADSSLCIMQMDFACKNRLGLESTLQCEGIYMLVDGDHYVAIHDIDSVSLQGAEMGQVFAFGNEMVYLSPEDFEKRKQGQIFEELTHTEALHYRAELFINYNGHKVGDDTDAHTVKIPVVTETGLWQVKHHVDDFNNELASTYIFLVGFGTYSHSAKSDIPLLAMLIIDNSGIKLKLYERETSLASDDDFVLKIRDSKGVVHDNLLFTNTGGNMIPASSEVLEGIQAIVKKGGIIDVSAQSEFLARHYVFKMDLSGIGRAKSYIRP